MDVLNVQYVGCILTKPAFEIIRAVTLPLTACYAGTMQFSNSEIGFVADSSLCKFLVSMVG